MTFKHTRAMLTYARGVVAGDIVACKWVRLACRRQLDDLARRKDADWPYRFDVTAAERVCKFIELLPHIKGKWAKERKLIELEPWQQFIQTVVFGWVHKDTGLRRFFTVYEEVARKNAKSTKMSANALYMLALDGEEGAEVYSAATKKDQAKIVFGVSRAMALKSPELRHRYGVHVQAHNLSVADTSSMFEALDAEAKSQDGLNIHFAAIDELHAHRTRALYDVLETATGSRDQPLLWSVTTAGSDRSGICYEQRSYVTKILDGVFTDETYFGIIYTLDDDDDWTNPAVWVKANPNLGVSVYEDGLERLVAKAKKMASARNNVLTKRFNMWVNADTAWMDMQAWDACGDANAVRLTDFAGEDCILGVDLASKVDINAKMRLFKRVIDGVDHFYVFGSYYLPEAQVEEGANDQYRGWEADGRLIVTPGNIIDMDRIEDDITGGDDLDPAADAMRFVVSEIAYDPHQATQLIGHLMDADMTCVEMRPTVLNFSEPMKQLEALAMAGRIHHDGDPVLTWMVSNVVCHLDAKDNIYPRKERVENKIDGAVALIMALGRAMANDEPAGGSYLDSADVLVL